MSTHSPRQTLRRVNLELVLNSREVGGPKKLAEMMNKPNLASHFTTLRKGRRGIGDDLAAAIERATGKPRGWMDEQHPVAGEDPAPYRVAQDLSPPPAFNDLPLIPWGEDIMNNKNEVFRAVLPDNALAPEYPKGTEIVWTTRRRLMPDRLVLVRDRHGQLHARQCHQGRGPGLWIAAAINPSYVSFDSVEDELTLIAVYKGRLEPDDV